MRWSASQQSRSRQLERRDGPRGGRTYEVGGDGDGHLGGGSGEGAGDGDGGKRRKSASYGKRSVPKKVLSKSCTRATGSHGRQCEEVGGGKG